MRKLLATTLFSAALAGCGHARHQSFVKIDHASLGRVVVYRNGVAYYERRAQVSGGALTVQVPRERVDDFLKSLTVVDASGAPLPVSFPRAPAGDGPFLEMTLAVPAARRPGEVADVVLTYVTEAPVWKPSYRIAVGAGGKVVLEGWAIVDNTSGEDWRDVTVGVGSSSALSFRYDLWNVRTVQRETLASDEQFAIAPPTAVSPFGGAGAAAAATLAELGDDEIRRPIGHPDNLEEAKVAEVEADASEARAAMSGAPAGGVGRAVGAMATAARRETRDAPSASTPGDGEHQARVADGDRKLLAVAPRLIASRQRVVLEGYGDPGEPGSEQRALDRANLVRNQLIDAGVPPTQIRVVNRGVVAGQAAGVRLLAESTSAAAAPAPAGSDPAETPVGESHFQSATPMTVARGTSVMVSMVRSETPGESVYLYDAEGERGNRRFAFKAVRLKNPTDSTLESGPVTVYGDGRYIGEGLTEPIPPRANVVVPFALDRQVVIDRDDATENQVARLVTLQRGVLTAEVQHIKRTKLTVTSRLHTPTTVYVRHTPTKGWTTLASPAAFERIGDANLYEVRLGAGATATVEIAEATPLVRTLDLGSPTTLDLMTAFVQSPLPGPELKRQLGAVLAVHREIADAGERIASLREHAAEYRTRMDELEGQIVSLRKVKSATELQRNLQDKMKDISSRVQKTTIDIVDTQESLMLAKVRFADQLAELTLPDAAAVAVDP